MRTSSVLLFLSFVLFSQGGILLSSRVQRCGFNNPDNCPLYDYKNPGGWGALCRPYAMCSAGKQQSPVDISTSVKGAGTAKTLNVLYSPAKVTLFNTGNKLVLPISDFAGIFTSPDNSIYALNSLEFHTPSEHTIDGVRFDMEVQFKHTTVSGDSANIAILFTLGKKSHILDTFWDQLPRLTSCSCGNGRFEPWMGEECDDGPRNSDTVPNACRKNCKWFSCGDGVIDATEVCDGGAALNSNSSANCCRLTCTLPFCGDGVVDSNNQEFCDDGNNLNGDGCSSRCTIEETCGNGIIDVGEECDNGLMNSNTLPNACRLNCVLAHCGDGVVDATEECDAGIWATTTNSSNLCRTTCTLPVCGDGIVDDLMGEMCDDSSSSCDECRQLCGNQIVDSISGEQCDDGPLNCDTKPNACRTSCRLPRCGDGVTDRGEQCDDAVLTARCNTTCTFICGNGVLDGTEACDNGVLVNAQNAPNGCRANCVRGFCGDGVIDTAFGEECDTIIGTAFCRANCKLPICGDGVLDTYYGEECDDGNNVNGDGCSQLCLKECGNGCFDGFEQCDDGNLNSDVMRDACRSTCVRAMCGDGVEDSGEECDNGLNNANLPNQCRLDCTLPYCGDGLLDTASGEVCDNGIFNSDTLLDGCSTSCIPNRCRQTISDSIVEFGKLVPEKCEQGYYTYMGSETTPPCREGVSWYVYGQPQTMSREQLQALRSVITLNSRPTQVLGSRAITNPTDDVQRCGNGIRESQEECDDPTGNSDSEPNRCRTSCKLPSCGDGVVDCGEQCDGGQTCTSECLFGIAQRGNRTVVNMFFKDLVPYNHFCCNAQPDARTCSPCLNCFKQ